MAQHAFGSSIPVPEFKPNAGGGTGVGWLDGLINTATGLAASWWQYDSYDNYIKFQQQVAANSHEQQMQYTYQPGGFNASGLIMWGLVGLGAVLIIKAVK